MGAEVDRCYSDAPDKFLHFLEHMFLSDPKKYQAYKTSDKGGFKRAPQKERFFIAAEDYIFFLKNNVFQNCRQRCFFPDNLFSYISITINLTNQDERFTHLELAATSFDSRNSSSFLLCTAILLILEFS